MYSSPRGRMIFCPEHDGQSDVTCHEEKAVVEHRHRCGCVRIDVTRPVYYFCVEHQAEVRALSPR